MQVKEFNGLATFCILLVLSLFHTAAYSDNDNLSVEQLLEKYGKSFVIEFILERRFGEITVNSNGTLKDVWGKPNEQLVDPRSVNRDLEKLKMTTSEVENALERRKSMIEKEAKETSSSPRKVYG